MAYNQTIPAVDKTQNSAPCVSHEAEKKIFMLKYDQRPVHMFEWFLCWARLDWADQLVFGLGTSLTHSYIINVIIISHDLHHNMEINIPPSGVHRL